MSKPKAPVRQTLKEEPANTGRYTLKHPIEVNGVSKNTLCARHMFRMGDMAALQRYGRKHGIRDVSVLFGDPETGDAADVGAMLVLIESICQLPEGTCQQLHGDDYLPALEMIGPFLGGMTVSLATGSPRAGS